MEIILKPLDLQSLALHWRQQGLRIGFVPTMGALHEGHLSLIKEARKTSDRVVVSVFVNPTQFNNPDDFKKYPNTLDADLAQLRELNVDVAFTPVESDIYQDQKRYSVHENSHHNFLCGKTRPGHFDGVLTVVLKLLQLAQPTQVFMGEKDYQQLQLVRDMVKAFFIPTEVVSCATVRDHEGLAMSSRNQRLSPAGLQKARKFATTLREAPSLKSAQEQLNDQNIQIDYLEEQQGRRFAAVFIENVRLIDNVSI